MQCPRYAAAFHLVPMLPSGSLSGPLLGSLYSTCSPKLAMGAWKFRPLTLFHAVSPSGPLTHAFRTRHVCCRSHDTSAWLSGMRLSILDSRHSFRFLNRPLIIIMPTSVRPFDCESYRAEASVETCSRSAHLALTRPAKRVSTAWIDLSLSPLRIIDVCPSHTRSFSRMSRT